MIYFSPPLIFTSVTTFLVKIKDDKVRFVSISLCRLYCPLFRDLFLAKIYSVMLNKTPTHSKKTVISNSFADIQTNLHASTQPKANDFVSSPPYGQAS
jgi:hypothetical protein